MRKCVYMYFKYNTYTDMNQASDIVGLIPCSGTSSRIHGTPKFLLPCREGNLINNAIDLF